MNSKNIYSFKCNELIERNRIVAITDNCTVKQAAAGDIPAGVVLDNSIDGAVDVASSGIVKISAAAAIEAGESVSAGADGKAKLAAQGDMIVGIAVTGGGTDSLIDVLLK